jgi:flavin-dependent thymidylate synthase
MKEELSTYVDKSMYPAEPTTEVMPRVTLLSATPDPLGALGAMCAMYEGRVIRDLGELSDEDRRRYWEQVQLTHLKAPMEAIDLHFMVENVTRAFTHQMVRQRTAVYAQESLRFAVKEDIAARPGPMIQNNKRAQRIWETLMEDTWDAYKSLVANGIPAEEARGMLPHDTLTRLNYKTNLRNLVDHMGNRLCTQAQFEWRLVGAQIRRAIANYKPHDWQFRYIAEGELFRPVCYAMGHCPFTAEFDRGCTIRERVQRGEFDKIEDREWAADPTAAWQ